MFALQLLQVYLTTVDSRINVIETEKNVPANMETCIGSILACRGKMEVDELDPVKRDPIILIRRSVIFLKRNTLMRFPC